MPGCLLTSHGCAPKDSVFPIKDTNDLQSARREIYQGGIEILWILEPKHDAARRLSPFSRRATENRQIQILLREAFC